MIARGNYLEAMSDKPDQSNDPIEQKKARLTQQAASIARELAELEEIERVRALAAKHNLVLSIAPAPPKEGEKVVTLVDLIDRYRNDPKSNYSTLRYKVRLNYGNMMRRISEDAGLGPERIAELDASKIRSAYERWSEGGSKLSQGHSLIAKLRLLSSYGVNILNDEDCVRFSAILHKMRIPKPRGTAVSLTEEHAKAIRVKAHELKLPSIALAQAFQFDLRLKQTDTIGEWVPVSEKGVGVSDVVSESRGKWVRGLRWEEIDSDLVLRHIASFHQREIVVDLKKAPMVREELSKLGKLPTRGPVIMSEITGEPWTQFDYRRKWRKIANEAGIPINVKNGTSSLFETLNENRSPKAPAREMGMA